MQGDVAELEKWECFLLHIVHCVPFGFDTCALSSGLLSVARSFLTFSGGKTFNNMLSPCHGNILHIFICCSLHVLLYKSGANFSFPCWGTFPWIGPRYSDSYRETQRMPPFCLPEAFRTEAHACFLPLSIACGVNHKVACWEGSSRQGRS